MNCDTPDRVSWADLRRCPSTHRTAATRPTALHGMLGQPNVPLTCDDAQMGHMLSTYPQPKVALYVDPSTTMATRPSAGYETPSRPALTPEPLTAPIGSGRRPVELATGSGRGPEVTAPYCPEKRLGQTP